MLDVLKTCVLQNQRYEDDKATHSIEPLTSRCCKAYFQNNTHGNILFLSSQQEQSNLVI